MDCPPVKDLVAAIEANSIEGSLAAHLGECTACSDVVTALNEETKGLTISVGSLWMSERISCPHDDILVAHLGEELDAEEGDFITFHLKTVECPHCMARVEELREMLEGGAPVRDMSKVLDESMRRSAAFRDSMRD